MNSSYVKKQLLEILEKIKGSGSFVSSDNSPFIFPGMEVEGIGEIGFPVNSLEAKDMIRVARKAPFGKGSKTMLDTAVRSSWEIDACEISFNNNDWNKFIKSIIERIKPELGLEEYEVTANLYKLLIYEKGDFFLTHKDSEKEKGMFGSLIIALPAKHTGGELNITFDGRTEVIDFAGPANQYKIQYAAFYADCDHGIAPVTSGYRVCLAYNLVQQKGEEKIQMHKLEGYANQLAKILKASEDDHDIPKIILLGHQYTPSNYSMAMLKLNDRPKAEALILAAEKAGYYAKLGLVSSYQVGQLLGDYDYGSSRSYGRRGYDNDDDDDLAGDGKMGEVYDEHVSVEHWMQEGVPPLGNIQLEKENIISSCGLNEGEPIEKDAEGYTGNAGMEMTYWYHYGAVFLWPRKYQFDILSRLSTDNKLGWIAYYNNYWDSVNAEEIAIIKKLAEEGLNDEEGSGNSDYSPMADFLVHLKDKNYLADKGAALLTKYFSRITVESWLKLFSVYPFGYFEKVFITVGEKPEVTAFKHLLAVLTQLSSQCNSVSFVEDQTNLIPSLLHNLKLTGAGKSALTKDILRNVLVLSIPKAGDEAWLKNTKQAFTRDMNREYVNDVLVEVIFEVGRGSVLANQIMTVCKENLANRVDNKPQPPADWSRPLPTNTGSRGIWTILADFLQSPTQQVFDYRKKQNFRTDMENAIRHVAIDLKMETIKNSSPHTLRLTKTQDKYERDMVKWLKDLELLKKVNDFVL